MEISLKGLRVVVTAGGAGIGRVIAARFMADGARVHVCDVAEAVLAETRAALPGIGTTLADVSDAAQVDRLFDEAARNLGGLDVLVNNAGIAGPTAAVEDIAPADWERTIAINITGQFLCARRAVPLLKAAGGGLIVNMASVAGRLGYPLRTPYAASKWAVVGFTESLAMELGGANIRVNAILPGLVEGPRIERVIAAKAAAQNVSNDTMTQRYLDTVSLKRMVSPEDVAAMAAFLASRAGANISGQALSVCGNVERLI
jgi:NAD(P)-dependent dehydrogenase (short-subunit alcohol dehydrogenase family)